jgi:hypothetical protein
MSSNTSQVGTIHARQKRTAGWLRLRQIQGNAGSASAAAGQKALTDRDPVKPAVADDRDGDEPRQDEECEPAEAKHGAKRLEPTSRAVQHTQGDNG